MKVNVTYDGQNGTIIDGMYEDLDNESLLHIVRESIESGAIAGIRATSNVNLEGFVVDRLESADGLFVMIRPKTPFGA